MDINPTLGSAGSRSVGINSFLPSRRSFKGNQGDPVTSSSGSDTAFDASIHTYPTAFKLALGFALERLVAEMAREDVQILMQPERLRARIRPKQSCRATTAATRASASSARHACEPRSSPSTICFIILALAVALFVWNRLPIGIVAIATALALWATGLLTLNQALAGFGDPVVIFIASLFVVSEALDATGVTTWAGLQLIARVGDSHTRLVALSMLLAAGLTALISPNGAVAALVPMVVILAVRLGRSLSPSLLLMPVAFGAYAGSLLSLTGGAINVIVSEAALDRGFGRLRLFRVRAGRRPARRRHNRDRRAVGPAALA